MKFALTYNVKTWGLAMKEAQDIDVDNQWLQNQYHGSIWKM